MTVTAEAVASGASCGGKVVNVPERGRVDRVTKSLIVKVGIFFFFLSRNQSLNLFLMALKMCSDAIFHLRLKVVG